MSATTRRTQCNGPRTNEDKRAEAFGQQIFTRAATRRNDRLIGATATEYNRNRHEEDHGSAGQGARGEAVDLRRGAVLRSGPFLLGEALE